MKYYWFCQVNLGQHLSPAVPLCIVHLLEAPPKVTGDAFITVISRLGSQDVMQQTLLEAQGEPELY